MQGVHRVVSRRENIPCPRRPVGGQQSFDSLGNVDSKPLGIVGASILRTSLARFEWGKLVPSPCEDVVCLFRGHY